MNNYKNLTLVITLILKSTFLVAQSHHQTENSEEVYAIKNYGKPYLFRTTDTSGKTIKCVVNVIRAEEYLQYASNEIVNINPPLNRTKSFIVKVVAMGYKTQIRTLRFGKFDLLNRNQKETVVDFELTKINKGDYLDFEFTNFIDNTLVLEEQAKSELDSLAQLLKSDPSFNLIIYGHCNKKGRREVKFNQSNSDLFRLDSLHITRQILPAHSLSLKRAELIKAYLIKKGNSPSRIKIKGNGGDFPLSNENSSMSYLNNRIEGKIL